MTSTRRPLIPTLTAIAALTSGMTLAGAAMAQTNAQPSADTPSQARARATTQSLNASPADSVLRPDRVTAEPPLTQSEPSRSNAAASAPATRPASRTAAQATPVRTIQTAPDDAATRLLNSSPPTATPESQSGAPEIVTERTPLIRGYYVKGDMDCDQVWPGEGNLAWLSDTSFTLDFGGCDPGQIVEVGPNTWHEDQRCQTELGGDGGVYSIQYEQTAADTIVRRATLSLDGSVEEDPWKLCPVERVPEEARFHDQAG